MIYIVDNGLGYEDWALYFYEVQPPRDIEWLKKWLPVFDRSALIVGCTPSIEWFGESANVCTLDPRDQLCDPMKYLSCWVGGKSVDVSRANLECTYVPREMRNDLADEIEAYSHSAANAAAAARVVELLRQGAIRESA